MYETPLYKVDPGVKYSAGREHLQNRIIGKLCYKIQLFSNIQFHKPQLNMFRQIYLKCRNLDASSVVSSISYGNQIDQLFSIKGKDTEYVKTQLVQNAIFNINYLVQSICYILNKFDHLKTDSANTLIAILSRNVAKYINLVDTYSFIPIFKEIEFYYQRQFIDIICK